VAYQDHPAGHVNVNGPLLCGGVVYQGGAKDCIYFPIVGEGLNRLTLQS